MYCLNRSISSQVFQQYEEHCLKKSCSSNNVEVLTKRGFKPSDRRDPHKRQFLMNLSKQIWHYNVVSFEI